GAAVCASGLSLAGWSGDEASRRKKDEFERGTQLVSPGSSRVDRYVPDVRTHPAEGLKRENIVITDIKVTPLSYVAPKDKYLWRVGGLVVWKSDAALVQIFTNKGIVGIGEGSPYCQ